MDLWGLGDAMGCFEDIEVVRDQTEQKECFSPPQGAVRPYYIRLFASSYGGDTTIPRKNKSKYI